MDVRCSGRVQVCWYLGCICSDSDAYGENFVAVECVAVCCDVMQCVAVCCSALQLKSTQRVAVKKYLGCICIEECGRE